MTRIIFAIFMTLMLTGCLTTRTDVTDFYAVEAVNNCESKQFVLAESYKYQKSPTVVNTTVTTHEYVCAKKGVAGKKVLSFDYFKDLQNNPPKGTAVMFIPPSQGVKFRHLYR